MAGPPAAAAAAAAVSATAPRFPRGAGGRRDTEAATDVDWLWGASVGAPPSPAVASSLLPVVGPPELVAEPAPATTAAAAAGAVAAEGPARWLPPTTVCAFDVTASAAAAAAEYMAVLGVWSGKPPPSAPGASTGAARYGPP